MPPVFVSRRMIKVSGVLSIGMVFTVLVLATVSSAREINGFELDDALIPPDQIFHGGPSKGGIPALDQPKFEKAGDIDFLKEDDRVLGIEINGVAKAYPIRILNWHEIVNDSIGNHYFVITYCPLCGTGMAFESRVDNLTLHFGVSGLLYNSDVLLYDRESESLWSQLLAKAVTGKHRGTALQMLPVLHTTWSNWKRYHPHSLVLSESTGYWRNYSKDPYRGYEKSRDLYFPVFNRAPGNYHPKEKILGLTVNQSYKAYPFVELNKFDSRRFTDTVDGRLLTIHWNREAQSGYITDDIGKVVPTVQSYWFAWYAFHPQTMVFSRP